MRRHLNFYDYVLWTVGLLLLTLTVPVVPRWLDMGGQRKLLVAVALFLGAVALWAACLRPRFLTDNPTEHIDFFDVVMVASGLFFAASTCRNYLRWSQPVLTPHKMAIVAVLAFASLFAFYCVIDRGGLRKFAVICFCTGGLFLIPGLWKVSTGTVSPKLFYAYETNEAGYIWLIVAGAFLVFGMVAYFMQKSREGRG